MMDLYRKLLDLSLQSSRLYQSKATGFVHDTPETISLSTNFLFALSLLRHKTQETVQEAKFVLDRLLYFQNSDGNFPVYFHDFPVCRDFNMAGKILAPLYWIRKEFSHILGEALNTRLNHSFEMAQKFVDTVPSKTARAYSEMTPLMLADEIVLAQMKGQFSAELLECLTSTWHLHSKKYCGGAVQSQSGYAPEITLYDYFMGYFTEKPSDAILKPQFAAIRAALLPLVKPSLVNFSDTTWATSLRSNQEPLFLVAGEHTALLHVPGGVVEEIGEGKIVMTLSEEVSPENIEKADVISLFVDAESDVSVAINGQRSTTFDLADKVCIQMGTVQLCLEFQIEGLPQYRGHVMKGNRPRQKLQDRAYDWQILLRKLRGDGKSKLTLRYSIVHA